MIEITNYITHLIVSLGGFGVFIASLIEEIVVPIPSTLVQSGAGLFLLGDMSLSLMGVLKLITLVALPSAFGVAIGSLVVYGIAFYGGMYAIKKYGKYFFINYEKLEKARSSLADKPKIVVAIAVLRFIPIFPNVLLTATSGLLRVPIKKYVVSTFIGIFIRALYLGALGWFTGRADSFVGVDSFFGKIGILVLSLTAISIVVGVIVSYINKRKPII